MTHFRHKKIAFDLQNDASILKSALSSQIAIYRKQEAHEQRSFYITSLKWKSLFLHGFRIQNTLLFIKTGF